MVLTKVRLFYPLVHVQWPMDKWHMVHKIRFTGSFRSTYHNTWLRRTSAISGQIPDLRRHVVKTRNLVNKWCICDVSVFYDIYWLEGLCDADLVHLLACLSSPCNIRQIIQNRSDFELGLCFSIGRSNERRFPLVGRLKIVGRIAFVDQSVSQSVCSSIFGNSVRTAGPIGTGVPQIDAPIRRNDDGAGVDYHSNHPYCVTKWQNPKIWKRRPKTCIFSRGFRIW